MEAGIFLLPLGFFETFCSINRFRNLLSQIVTATFMREKKSLCAAEKFFSVIDFGLNLLKMHTDGFAEVYKNFR